MAEFKFSCPHCGQNIQCDEQWGGQQIACPACSGNLVVPQLQPAASPAPVPARQRVVSQPQVPARPAQPPPKFPKTIVAWSIGGAVFLAAIIFCFMNMDSWQSAFNKKTQKMAAAPGGGEMTHIAKIYQVLDATDPGRNDAAQARAAQREEREKARIAEELKPKPDPTLAMPVLPAIWTLDADAAAIPKGRVNGSSGGADFHVEAVRLDRTPTLAVLAFQEGAGTTADHELFVSLPATAKEDLAGRSWTVSKETKSQDAPQILKRWTLNPKYAPSEKIFYKGYVMKLELDPPTRDWQQGRIFIALPDTNQTVLAGAFSIAIPRKEVVGFPPE